jgi:hypothetical protein
MNYEEFKGSVKDHILEYLPESYADAEVMIHSVVKNNSVHLDGLTVRIPNSNISPNIYLNQYFRDYEDGRDFEEIMHELASVRIRSDNAEFPMVSDLTCLDKIKDKIQAKLVNKARNGEYLADKPFTEIADLAVIYYIELDRSEHGSANVVITNNMLDIFGITVSELHAIALENMHHHKEARFLTMAEVLKELMHDSIGDLDFAEPPLYVLTNSDKVNGAALLLDAETMDHVSERIGQNFYILPSSIHETIFVPASITDSQDLSSLVEMVVQVNGSEVQPEEVLSDHVYRYDYSTHSLEIAA